MDLLVYNKDHWYDETTQKRRDEVDAQFPGRFAKRNMRGDIIEVRPDGHFQNGFDKSAFALIQIPGVKVDKYLQEPQWDGKTKITTRRYRTDMSYISLDAQNTAEITELADAHVEDKAGVPDIGNG
jgi:hypothetical protein